ncbi:MAG: hypothetical protein N7Q72_05060, partial [Spiroplasma sp. Tabriz.8]|nr:hypothetical protein [Spiroplasma sp. Tabriz.8]
FKILSDIFLYYIIYIYILEWTNYIIISDNYFYIIYIYIYIYILEWTNYKINMLLINDNYNYTITIVWNDKHNLLVII